MTKIIEHDQGSQDWLNWRLGGIGGSDSNLIAAYFLATDYPYGNTWPGAALYKLWCEKTGRIAVKPSKNQSFGDYIDPKEHGRVSEPLAREWWSLETGEFAAPAVLQHETLPHMIASLDGYDPGNVALEIKCPKEPGDHRKAKEGEIPQKYLAQMHHNYFVAAVPEFHFVSYFAGEGVIIPFKPDPKFMDELRTAEETFWSWVVGREFPLPKGDVETKDAEWIEAMTGYFELLPLQREVEAKMRIQKLHIMRLMTRLGGRRVTGGGAKVSLGVRGKAVIPSFERPEFLNLLIQHAAGGEDDAND